MAMMYAAASNLTFAHTHTLTLWQTHKHALSPPSCPSLHQKKEYWLSTARGALAPSLSSPSTASSWRRGVSLSLSSQSSTPPPLPPPLPPLPPPTPPPVVAIVVTAAAPPPSSSLVSFPRSWGGVGGGGRPGGRGGGGGCGGLRGLLVKSAWRRNRGNGGKGGNERKV